MNFGFFDSVQADDYHNDPCGTPSLNYSTAKELVKRDPWHGWAKHPRLGGERWTASAKMDEGNIVHALLLEQPLDGLLHVVDAADFRANAAKDAKKAGHELGRYVILAPRLAELRAGVPFMLANLRDAGVILDGYREATVIWESDCVCRTRIDHITRDHLLIQDLKCSEDPDPDFLERHIVDMCYDIQGAAEIEAIETTFPETIGRVRFEDVFIWTSEPWFVIVAEHSESMLDLGRHRWSRAKRTWNECIASGVWGGPKNRIQAHAPNWAIKKEFGELA